MSRADAGLRRASPPAPTIPPRLVHLLGLSQLLCWGVSYYLVGVFGPRIAATTGWSPVAVSGGFSGALVAMGLTSPPVGRLIDRHGGRPVMVAGSALMALCLAGIALSRTLAAYWLAFAGLGVAMRMTLYEAAFAALVRIGGRAARRPISAITLLGGLASTVFWPIGDALADALGWRGALLAYAGTALATVPIHLAIPRAATRRAGTAGAPVVAEAPGTAGAPEVAAPLTRTPGERVLAGGLYALVVMLSSFLNSAMSAHMIAVLAALGASSSAAVWVSALRGVGQSLARLAEMLFGGRLDPLGLGVLAAALLPVGFAAGFAAGASPLAGAAFAFTYGAGNGLLTITRGTQPLVLFEPAEYGRLVGWLVAPSFLLAALGPLTYAALIEARGAPAALAVSLAAAGIVLAGSLALRLRFGRAA